jgi:hypothetical protein
VNSIGSTKRNGLLALERTARGCAIIPSAKALHRVSQYTPDAEPQNAASIAGFLTRTILVPIGQKARTATSISTGILLRHASLSAQGLQCLPAQAKGESFSRTPQPSCNTLASIPYIRPHTLCDILSHGGTFSEDASTQSRQAIDFPLRPCVLATWR